MTYNEAKEQGDSVGEDSVETPQKMRSFMGAGVRDVQEVYSSIA